MINIEFHERRQWGKPKVPVAKIIFDDEHFLAPSEVVPLLQWPASYVSTDVKSPTQIVFHHYYLRADAIYEHEIVNIAQSWTERSSLTLIPLDAFLHVQLQVEDTSVLKDIAKYMSAKNPHAKITWQEIIGKDDLVKYVRNLYRDYGGGRL